MPLYYGHGIEIAWIYYGFSGAISNLIDIVWISYFFPSARLIISLQQL
jgi:hypothetical protein